MKLKKKMVRYIIDHFCQNPTNQRNGFVTQVQDGDDYQSALNFLLKDKKNSFEL